MLDPTVIRRQVERFVRRPPAGEAVRPARAALSERESNAEIAARLFVSAATVKTHDANVLPKLGLRDRVQAVVFAHESGLAEPGSP
jgi:DNA-binding NarL/FixJ family response regulator